MLSVDLQNFRCFTNKQITLPDSGVALINAVSGRGKTSLMNSILYAITGKLKNISTFGKKSTSVSVEIDGMKITRSKAPNRLTVVKGDKIVEDSEAQETIDKIFGKEFANVSYIDQDNINSFIFLSPSDKMDFLQSLLLKEYNIDAMKEKIKTDLARTKDEYLVESSKVDTLTSLLLKGEHKDLPVLEISGIKITRKNFLKVLETSKKNLDTSELNTKKIEDKIRKFEADSALLLKKQAVQKTLDELLKQQEELNEKVSVDRCTILEQKKKTYLQNKELSQFQTKLKELKEKYGEISQKNAREIISLQEILKGYQPDLKKLGVYKKGIELYRKIYELDEKIPENLELWTEQIEKLSGEIDECKKELVNKQTFLKSSEQCYECPSCKKALKFLKEDLVLLENFKKLSQSEKQSCLEEIKDLEKKVDICKKKKSVLEKEHTVHEKNTQEYNELLDKLTLLVTPTPLLEEMEKEVGEIEENEKKFKEIANKIQHTYEDSLERQLSMDIKMYEKKIERLTSDCTPPNGKLVDEEEFLKITEELVLLKDLLKRLSDIEKKVEDTHGELKKFGSLSSGDNSQTELESKRKSLDEWREKVVMNRQNISKLEEYFQLVKEIERGEKIQNDIQESIGIRNCKNERMKALVKLREHIKNAERKSISEFVGSLNSHASVYLEYFFPDDDMIVNLRTIQETKTGKEKVALNFEVNYKGMVDCDLSSLSGGERDRVNLAFTLALSEMVDNRILMLDECISSLDIEASNKVVETLREKYKGRLVLLVSHQIGTGGFDHVLNL